MRGIVVEDCTIMSGAVDFERMVKQVRKLNKKVDDMLVTLNSEQLLDVGLGLGIRKGRIENRTNLVVLREISNYIEKRCLESPEDALALLNPLYRDMSERLTGGERSGNLTESESSETEGDDFESAKESAKEDGGEPKEMNDDLTDKSDIDDAQNELNTDGDDVHNNTKDDKEDKNDENDDDDESEDEESEEEESEEEKSKDEESEKEEELRKDIEQVNGNDPEEDPEKVENKDDNNDPDKELTDEGNKRLFDENERLKELVRKLETVLKEKELEAEEKELKKQADEDKLRK